jgi:hypothetical protein
MILSAPTNIRKRSHLITSAERYRYDNPVFTDILLLLVRSISIQN